LVSEPPRPAQSGAPRSAPRTLLTGWGRTAPTGAQVVHPTPGAVDELAERVRNAGRRGVLARGLGRSYGDAAQNAGGTVLDMTALDRIRSTDFDTGVVDVEAGVSLETLMRIGLPQGWFVPVTPGTRFVTVGGAIAADVHGKNHHADGSFAQHVERIELLDGNGELRVVTPESTPDLFWATAGGMGLTGVIVSARIRLIPVRTAYMSADIERCRDLDDVMSRLSEGDDRYRYTVAWLDNVATGAQLGRGALIRGDHATLDQLPERRRAHARRFAPGQPLKVPAWAPIPSGLLNARTVGLLNAVWWRKHPMHKRGDIESITSFFHPLDMIGDWNRGYGPRGFLQYQYVVPFGAEDVVRESLERLAEVRAPSFLTVLKRFGPGDPGPLSFPREGWTLALDFPAGIPGLPAVLDRLDERVVEAGGTLYLAKESRVRPELLPAMYPRLDEWRKVRDAVDPHGVFSSDLSRRLGL
jgi:decaprenylphospho-beta-D-ribofuranose 2-oxidase